MRSALLAAFALAAATSLHAQSPAQNPAPLQAMPYSPSLDLTSLDRTVDPCVDFYKFSCGGWQKLNPIPADQASWSVYGKLGTLNQQFLWGILQDAAVMKQRTPDQQKIGDYFAACMNTAAIDQRGYEPIKAGLARIDGLSTRPALLAALGPVQRDGAGSYFFGAGTGQDALDSSLVIAMVGAGGLGLPDRDYYLKQDAKSVKIREQYTAYIVRLLGMIGESPTAAAGDATAILRIETALAQAQLSRVDRRDPHKTYHPMTVEELQVLAPAIDWKQYFLTVGATTVKGKLNVSQPEALKAVNAELSAEPLEALRAYLRFHLATASAASLSMPFQQASFDFFSTTLRGIPAMPPRWKTCTRQVDHFLGEALGTEFVRRTFSPDMKAKTQLMTVQIEAAMKQEIQSLDWMTPATKAEALRKLAAIRNKIGYPDKERDYASLTVKPNDYFGDVERAEQFENARDWRKLGQPVDLNEWGMTPPTVNAYFNPQNERHQLPGGRAAASAL